MARVYSTRFLFAALADGETATYTCPTGFVAVLRFVTCAQVVSGAGSVAEWVLQEVGGAGVVFLEQALSGISESSAVQLRLVFTAGEAIRVENENTPELHLTASGYLLSLP
jgi:hypothetical protein